MCLSAVSPMLLKYNIELYLHAQSLHSVASLNMSSEISALAHNIPLIWAKRDYRTESCTLITTRVIIVTS